MSVVKKLVKYSGGVAGWMLNGKKKPKPVVPAMQPTVGPAASVAQSGDILSKRRGAGANAILGAKGAESSAGKSRLGM